jgi:tetratricopeptide (TPR) repeat protein
MKYFPAKTEEGSILSDIAQVKFDNNIGTKMEQFNAFDEAFKKDEENFTSPKSLYTYFSLAVDLFNSGEKELQDIFDLYDVVVIKIEKEENKLAEKLTPLMDTQDAGTSLSSKEERYMKAYETNLGAYGKVKGSVDGKLGQLADCPNLIPLYEKDFETKKNEVEWIKRAAGRLSAKDCDDPLFFKLVQQLHILEPSAKSAYYLGKLAQKEGKSGTALEYFNQAAELETNPRDKAKVYMSIAENFRQKGNMSSARIYYNKVLEFKPSEGVAYLRIAQMYAASADNCGNTVFEKRAINWLAADMAEKAARVDANIASNARAAAESYRLRAPSKSDIFSDDMAGKTISFNCWVGGSVRVPNL